MKTLVWSLVVLLVFLHQGFWQWGEAWNEAPLVFGFLPLSLAYHAVISLAAAGVWMLALKFCWPDDLEACDEIADAQGERQGERQGDQR
jgi:hypothetical protein